MATKKKITEEPQSSPNYARSSTPADEAIASQVRWEPVVYAGLKAYASATHSSMNLVTNTIIASFLTGEEAQDAITAAQEAQTEAIRKLSGG